ncbi:MAG: GWxTD domain-containing protein [Acidobacteria bacterium]|jgi:GWxTD domain-containing protein|nr:GWxTD domain-containing protein [Acidobacteriota bacterium]
MPTPAKDSSIIAAGRGARRGVAWLGLLLIATGLFCGEPQKSPPLAEKYRQWLDLVDYIITPDERRIFTQLENDRDREAFMSIFWNQRDPNRSTAENEFKDEHIKRFQYASRYYGFTSPLPGWKTDRGRIHILLGPPANRNEVFNSYLYPIEIWEYYGEPGKGLPTMFNVVFYRKGGAGDFKLYIPAVDGPDKLLVTQTGEFSSQDYQAIYKKLNEIKPEVAEIALTLIPGERTTNFNPSMRDLKLMAKITELPKEHINTTYASQFLRFKSFVDIQNSSDYLGSRHELVLLRDPVSKLNFLHLAIWPERISVDYSSDTKKYTCSYKMVVDLRQGETIVYQHTKDLPFAYDKDEMDKTLANGLVLADLVPVMDGELDVTVFVQNSVNNEFASFSEKVRVPAPGQPALFGPLVSYRILKQARAAYGAFILQNLHASPDPQRTFGEREPLQVMFAVDFASAAATAMPEIEVTSVPAAGAQPYSRRLVPRSQGGTEIQVFTADLGALPPGYYRLQARVRDGAGRESLGGEASFTVSPMPLLPHPAIAAPTLAADKGYVFLGMLAAQFETSGRTGDAGRTYEEALRQAGENPALRIAYGRFLLGQAKYERLLDVLAPVPDQGRAAFDRFALRGKAFYHLARYQEAVDELLQANALYDSDISVLNALGLSFLRLNNPQEAKKALAASLKIKAAQPDIAALLKQVEAP